MIRRVLCLVAFLLAVLLTGPACNGDKKAPNKAPKVADPDADAKPQVPGAKAG